MYVKVDRYYITYVSNRDLFYVVSSISELCYSTKEVMRNESRFTYAMQFNVNT